MLISIRAKIMGAFVAVFLISVLAILYLLSARVPESLDRLARVRVVSALQGIDNDFNSLCVDIQKRVESIAGDSSVIEDVWTVTKTASRRRGHFIDRIVSIRGTTGLDILRVIDANKNLIADGADPAKFDIKIKDDPYLDGALKSGSPRLVLKKESSPAGERVKVVVYQPVWSHEAPVAVLVGGSYIGTEYLRRLRDLTTARVVLFVDYRPVVSSVEGDPAEGLPVGRDFLERLEASPDIILQAGSGEGDYMVGGVPLRDPETGALFGFFVMGISRDSVKSIMKQTRSDILIVALIGLAISIVFAFVVSIGITRPISGLVQFARRIGRGEFSGAYTPVRSLDEVGILAETMNRMVKDLDEYSQRLAYTERVAAWNEIARRMAHEIKNPLSPIQLSMENLKASFRDDRDSFDRFFPDCANTVLEEVDRLRKLANEFSEFARLPKPVFEDVDVGDMLKNLVSFQRATVPEKISIELSLDEGSLMVRGDRDQLNRVFTNLIKNAVEAMPGGGTLRIMVRIRHGEVFIIFEDEGEGIPHEDLDRIFLPYYTSKTGGTGLGLSIVKRIIKDHNASIDADSEPGRGTRFTIVFKELLAGGF